MSEDFQVEILPMYGEFYDYKNVSRVEVTAYDYYVEIKVALKDGRLEKFIIAPIRFCSPVELEKVDDVK